jgi:hypothetical protein
MLADALTATGRSTALMSTANFIGVEPLIDSIFSRWMWTAKYFNHFATKPGPGRLAGSDRLTLLKVSCL